MVSTDISQRGSAGEDTRSSLPWRGYGAAAALVLGGFYVATAALGHHATDPSLNVAAPDIVRNPLGPWGAMVADIALQLCGWAATPLGLAAAVGGLWRLIEGPRLPRWLGWRAGLGVLACLLATAALAALPVPATWGFRAGLGGLLGDGVLALLAAPFEFLGLPGGKGLTGVLAGCGALCAGWTAFGLSARDARDGAGAFMAGARAAGVGAAQMLAGLAHLLPSRGDRPDPEEDAARARQFYGVGPAYDSPFGASPFRQGRNETPTRARRSAAEEDRPRFGPTAESAAEVTERAAKPPARARPKPRRGGGFQPPSLELLQKPRARTAALDATALDINARRLMAVLNEFGVEGRIVNASPGPVVTLYELEPAPGTKANRVIGLADDIARSMSAISARVATVPGRNVIGIELPNTKREAVYLRALLESQAFQDSQASLPLALGETIGGEPLVADLAKMPHLLIAGTTGSGKSVGVNAMILSLMYRLSPAQCRFVMIDPKMVELSVYDGAPHLLAPVVTDARKAVAALKWTVREMEDRYQRMKKLRVRNFQGYNERVAQAKASGEAIVLETPNGFDRETGEPLVKRETIEAEPLPLIVVVVDEVADLMAVAGKDIEITVQRLGQMARAAGIHLIMATQRPSVDVITGTIKANLPTRISYQVTSKIDSRTILGEQGAEQLLGQGDLLFMAGGGRISRLHGPFVADGDVEAVVQWLKAQGQPDYRHDVTQGAESEDGELPLDELGGEGEDDLYSQAVAIVLKDRRASTSYIQRRLQIGYNRAATVMERMEDEGIVGPANHAGKREILIPER